MLVNVIPAASSIVFLFNRIPAFEFVSNVSTASSVPEFATKPTYLDSGPILSVNTPSTNPDKIVPTVPS